MSNGLHSQAWLIAGKVLFVVTVTLFTGGTLYLVNNQFIPAPLSESFHPQSPRIASQPKVHTPPQPLP